MFFRREGKRRKTCKAERFLEKQRLCGIGVKQGVVFFVFFVYFFPKR